MKDFLMVVLGGVLIFVIVIAIVLLIAYALGYILTIIPCTVLVYAETFLLLGIFMLLALVFIKGFDSVTTFLSKNKK